MGPQELWRRSLYCSTTKDTKVHEGNAWSFVRPEMGAEESWRRSHLLFNHKGHEGTRRPLESLYIPTCADDSFLTQTNFGTHPNLRASVVRSYF
jgi:hypothetical protein